MDYNIFISYKRVDKERVFKLKHNIESNTGQQCWIDLDGIESDAQFASVIISAINNCSIFLFMYSKQHSIITDYDNDWTIREINFAQKKKKRIVFINIDGSELTDWFELMFGTKQQIDSLDSEAMQRLYKDIRNWLGATAHNDINKNREENAQKAITIQRPKENVAHTKPNVASASTGLYNVVLSKVSANKLQAVKAVKEVLGIGLKEAKDFVDYTPSVIAKNVNYSTALSLKKEIEQTDAIVEIVDKHYISPNDLCPCGSGIKFKNCHGRSL